MSDSVQKETLAERLGRYFTGRGFLRVETHTESMKIYYTGTDASAYLVWMIMPEAVEEMTKELYQKRLETIRKTFTGGTFQDVHVLALLFTKRPEKAREIAADTSFWIVDEAYGRLIIYEDQMADYLGIRSVIEKNLHFGADIRNEDGMQKKGVLAESANTVTGVQNKGAKTAGVQFGVKKGGIRRPSGDARFTAGVRKALVGKPYMTTALVAVTVIMFILQSFNESWRSLGANAWTRIFDKQEYYRLFTCMFLHANIEHLVNNMLSLYVIGSILEESLGHWKYLIAYFLSGIAASITSCCYYRMAGEYTYSIGASGAIFGITGIFVIWLLLSPEQRARISPVRIGLFLVLTVSQLGVFRGLTNSESTIDYAAHVGGFVFGTVFGLLWMAFQKLSGHRRRRKWRQD